MICLGASQGPPTPLQSEAAELHAVNWFRQYFLAKFPTGIVISQLEFMGRTTAPPAAVTPLRMFGQPRLNQILDALAHDFRRWSRDRDYRKCDALGIANDGFNAELLEITTENNMASAVTQVNAKLAILRQTVNRIHNLTVDWRPTLWKPAGHQQFVALPSTPQEVTYLCYVPTTRSAAVFPGVVLYEVHRLARATAPAPVPAPSGAKKRAQDAAPHGSRVDDGLEARARRFLDANPDIAGWIRALAAVLAVAAVIAAIVALIDPVPGDEVAAASFAAALFRIAVGRAG